MSPNCTYRLKDYRGFVDHNRFARDINKVMADRIMTHGGTVRPMSVTEEKATQLILGDGKIHKDIVIWIQKLEYKFFELVQQGYPEKEFEDDFTPSESSDEFPVMTFVVKSREQALKAIKALETMCK